jgi:subtilase family serine protease
VRKGKTIALVASAGVLAAALVGAATQAAPMASARAATAGTRGPLITIRPGVIRPAGRLSTPSPRNCEKKYHLVCYLPSQIQVAYNLPALYSRGITGKGETIVIVDPFGSPTIKHDLAVFDKRFRLPAPPSFKIITPSGALPPWLPGNYQLTGWGAETTLDVEYAHAIAPGASILLVETPITETEGVTGFPQIVQAEDYVLAHFRTAVISQSFSTTEETFTGIGQLNHYHLRTAYARAAAEKDGPTVVDASGDTGVANVGPDGVTYYTHPTVNWPSSDPLVTGVGGTELVAGKGSRYTSVAWNDTHNTDAHAYFGPSPMASGGGRSVLFSRPAYQNGFKSVTGAARGVPDISMSGACEGAVVTYQSFPEVDVPAGWYPDCGTSEATPEFAGIVALAAQVAGHPLGLINPTLYRLSAEKAPGIVPVTKGDNTVTFTQVTGNGNTYTLKGFNARAGYSLDDGVGTVNAWYLAYELAGKTPPK